MQLNSPVVLLIILAISALLYFLPSILGRNKKSFTSILLLNIFLGWTLIGWVVALVWAVSPDAIPVVFYDNNNSSKASEKTDELIKFKQLLDSGAITQEEYDKEKNRILNR